MLPWFSRIRSSVLFTSCAMLRASLQGNDNDFSSHVHIHYRNTVPAINGNTLIKQMHVKNNPLRSTCPNVSPLLTHRHRSKPVSPAVGRPLALSPPTCVGHTPSSPGLWRKPRAIQSTHPPLCGPPALPGKCSPQICGDSQSRESWSQALSLNNQQTERPIITVCVCRIPITEHF